MENQTTPCKALVLAGGGARGSYQVGVWKALMELDWHPQIITGTSVGSLNGAMFVLDLYEVARDMWLTIRSKDVMELPEENADLSALHSFLRSVVKAGGMDVSPLEEIVERVLDEDALRRANIRFGLVTVEQRGLKARELTLDEIPQGRVKDYLMASAACFPALRARDIDGVKFLDGGYSDNMPTGLAKKMGADELVCVDLEGVGITRPNLTGLPTTMVRSYWELGDILHFDPDTARRNVELGYYDTLRAFGRVRGCAYAVDNGPDSSADAAAFRARFDAVQKAVREKYPVTLTADAALLLARPLALIFVSKDPALLLVTIRGFSIYSLSFLMVGYNIYASSFFTALNDGFISALISFARTLLFQVAAVIVLPVLWDIDGVWAAVVAAETLALLLSAACLVGKRKKYGYA